MWEWIHGHHDELQALGPLATIFAALIAVVVTGTLGVAQWKISRAQKDIAYDKLKLDLYDRRFKIFSSTLDFYQAMMSWTGTPEQKDARARFFMAYQESSFLFTKKSGVEAVLKILNDESMKVISHMEHPEIYTPNPTLMIETNKEIDDIRLRVFNEGLEKLRASMRPYLDFSKVLYSRSN